MPEGRLIKRKITMSRRLNKLPLQCRYLMREFIIWVDKEGRLDGDPHWINREFFCGDLDDYKDEQVAEWLKLLHGTKKNGSGLIELYEVDGVQYIWLPGFIEEQNKTWYHGARNSEAESSIPPPPSASEKRKAAVKPAEEIYPTPFEKELYEVCLTMKGWEAQRNEDLSWLRELTKDFQNVTVGLLKQCRDKGNDDPQGKGAWRNRMRNWLKHDIQYSKEVKGGKSGKHPRQLTPREGYTESDNS